jgi:hypothetical protein
MSPKWMARHAFGPGELRVERGDGERADALEAAPAVHDLGQINPPAVGQKIIRSEDFVRGMGAVKIGFLAPDDSEDRTVVARDAIIRIVGIGAIARPVIAAREAAERFRLRRDGRADIVVDSLHAGVRTGERNIRVRRFSV